MLYLTQSPQITGLTRCIMEPTDHSRERRLVKLLPSRMTRYATHNITQQGKEQHVFFKKIFKLGIYVIWFDVQLSFNLYLFQVVVHGFIESDSYSPLLNISVIPQVTYRLAPAIWKKMYNYDPNWYGGHGSGGASVAPHRTSRVTAVIPVILVMILTSMMTRTRVSW